MQRVAPYLPSFLLCLSAAAATFWVRSYHTYDELERDSWSASHAVAEHRSTHLRSGRGTVYFFQTVERVQLPEPPARRPSSSVSEWTATPASQSQYPIDAPCHALHDKAPAWAKPLARLRLAYSREDKQDPNRGDWPRGSITSSHRAASAPYWLPVAASLAWPAVRFARRATRARIGHQRRRAGLCANCGYDLRSSAGRCPECGAADTAESGASAATPARGASRRHALIVGSFLAACAVACLFNLRAAAGREPLSLAAEHRRLDRMISNEVRRGIAQIRHPGTSRDNRRFLYGHVASFGTPEAVEFLAETYEEYKRHSRLGDLDREGPDLTFMLWRIPRPESADVLLRMLQDGVGDVRLIDAYTAVAGNESVPHLRRLLDKPPNETIRYGAWRALLHYKEPRAVADYLSQVRALGRTPEDLRRLSTLLTWAAEARMTEAIPTLETLARPDGVAAHPLRSQIVRALLRLGHWASVPEAIELIANEVARRGSAVDAASQIASPEGSLTPSVDVLMEVTGEDFGTDFGRWRLWWNEQGRHQSHSANAATPPTPETTSAVERAFLTWAITPAGGVVPGPVVYVQGDRARSTETIRYYSDAELRLLGVPRIRIDGITIKGDTVRVSYYGPDDFHGPGPTAELTRGAHGWTVKGKAYVSEFLPADGGVF
jgi:hypothetical protein